LTKERTCDSWDPDIPGSMGEKPPAVPDPEQRLIVVSNRLPYVLNRSADGAWGLEPGSGGLVTALVPVLRNRGGVWIGWSGTTEPIQELDSICASATRNAGYTLKPVRLTPEEHEKFYYGFANEEIWPLFHDLQSHCNFDPSYWYAYHKVNHKYADVILENCREDDFIWVHDYQLMLVAKALREKGLTGDLGFFLHIPFPSPDIYLKLPRRSEILHALLEYSLIGFQTARDRRNFIQCIRLLLKDVHVEGKGNVQTIRTPHRSVRVGIFPIGIDVKDFTQRAGSEEVAKQAWYIHEDLPKRQLILGVDRLDYTKGLLNRLEAFRNALERYPDLHMKVTFIQVVVPSRVHIPKYQALKTEIEQLVGEINGQFTRSSWVPLHYIFRSIDSIELLAYYRTAEIAMVTPLKDGMNLVSKEYCACSLEENCALILSEFAGSAAQLHRGALLVNPYDIEQVADAIHQAYTMGHEERRTRMRKMRRVIKRYDIFWWVDSFIRTAISKELDDFPLIEDYIPERMEEVPPAEVEEE
jgi:trehalose 6-phosphate synthase/phosphatase